MHAINSLQEIERVSYQTSRVVAILVATRIEPSVLEWLFSAWQTLHWQSGVHWHLAVPVVQRNYDKDFEVGDFNEPLSLELMNSYGLEFEATPALVFDHFVEDAKPPFVTLPSNERALKKLIVDISKTARHMNPDGERYQTVEHFAQLLKLNRLKRSIVELLPTLIAKSAGSVSKLT